MRRPLKTLRLMIVAGEDSGDAHAAALVNAIRELEPTSALEFFGSTGTQMRAAGVESVVREDDLAITGLVEIAVALPRFLKAYRELKQAAIKRRADAVVFVDWPDFNLPLARALHRHGLKTIYYISPQLWAWRSHRVRQVERDVDLMLTILPFENEWYADRGVQHVEFVGHPLAGQVRPRYDRLEFCDRHKLDPTRPIVGLLPGSRRKNFDRNLPVMLEAAKRLARDRTDAQFALAIAARRTRAEAEIHIEQAAFANGPVRVVVVEDATREALAASDAAAVCSGTATLEAALCNTPLVVVYKESFLNWHLLGRLINVEHFGLINLLAGYRLAPELFQNDFTPDRLAAELSSLLDAEKNREVRAALAVAVEKLGPGEASQRAAATVLRFVQQSKSIEPALASDVQETVA